MSSLVLSDVAYAFPDGTPLFEGLDLAVGPGITSLVGRNGAGKSTLLRLCAGALSPSRGSVTAPGRVAFQPQVLTDARQGWTVADELGVASTLAALRRLDAGIGDEDDVVAVGDDWDAAERCAHQLDELGLPGDLDHPVLALSGGERTLLALAARLLVLPDVLLLDEPTNHLDTRARGILMGELDRVATGGRCVLVVSHDLELLERCDTTIELRGGAVRSFGGPYSLAREVIAAEQASARQDLDDARNTLRAEKRDKEDAQVVLARRERRGRKMQESKREPKIVMGERKRAAQVSAGRYRATHAESVERARERVHEADAAVRSDAHLRLDMPDPELPAGRIVMDVEDPAAGRVHLLGPERIRLAGANGSGKSTALARWFGGRESRARVPVAFLPQVRSVRDPRSTVVEHIAAVRPDADPEEAHAHAARFLFEGDAGLRRLGELSGGERLRAELAALLFARPVPGLLVLDEPTTDLDVDGVEVLAEAVAGWRGALLLVTHDEGFCRRVGVDRVIELA